MKVTTLSRRVAELEAQRDAALTRAEIAESAHRELARRSEWLHAKVKRLTGEIDRAWRRETRPPSPRIRRMPTPAPAPRATPAKLRRVWKDTMPLEDRHAWLVALLTAHQGNLRAASRASGKARSQLQRWCHQLGVKAIKFRRQAVARKRR